MKIILSANKFFLVYNAKSELTYYGKGVDKLMQCLVAKNKLIKAEVEKALNAMVDNKHNAVEFGVNGSFTVSKLVQTQKEMYEFIGAKVGKKKLRAHIDWAKLPSNRFSKDTYSELNESGIWN
jgi:hypothetical protein